MPSISQQQHPKSEAILNSGGRGDVRQLYLCTLVLIQIVILISRGMKTISLHVTKVICTLPPPQKMNHFDESWGVLLEKGKMWEKVCNSGLMWGRDHFEEVEFCSKGLNSYRWEGTQNISQEERKEGGRASNPVLSFAQGWACLLVCHQFVFKKVKFLIKMKRRKGREGRREEEETETEKQLRKKVQWQKCLMIN